MSLLLHLISHRCSGVHWDSFLPAVIVSSFPLYFLLAFRKVCVFRCPRTCLGVPVPREDPVFLRVQAADFHGPLCGFHHGPCGLALVGVAHDVECAGLLAPLPYQGHLQEVHVLGLVHEYHSRVARR